MKFADSFEFGNIYQFQSHCSCLSYPGTDFNEPIPISTWDEFDESMTWLLVMWNENETKKPIVPYDIGMIEQDLTISYLLHSFYLFSFCYLTHSSYTAIFSFQFPLTGGNLHSSISFFVIVISGYKRVRFFSVCLFDSRKRNSFSGTYTICSVFSVQPNKTDISIGSFICPR